MNITYISSRTYYNAIHEWIGADTNLSKEIEAQFDEIIGVQYLPDEPHTVDEDDEVVYHAHAIVDKDKYLLAKLKYGI